MKNDRKGQSLLEFALVIPIFLLMFLGIIEFGLALHSQITLVHSAREGARFGVVGTRTEQEIKQKVIDAAAGLNLINSNIMVEMNSFTNRITVGITYDYHVIDPVISSITGDTIILKGSAIMELE